MCFFRPNQAEEALRHSRMSIQTGLSQALFEALIDQGFAKLPLASLSMC